MDDDATMLDDQQQGMWHHDHHAVPSGASSAAGAALYAPSPFPLSFQFPVSWPPPSPVEATFARRYDPEQAAAVVPSSSSGPVAPLAKEERSEQRRQRALRRQQKLEASIAALQAKLELTKAAENEASQLAQQLAIRAAESASSGAHDHYDPAAAEAASHHSHSLPPLSPLDLGPPSALASSYAGSSSQGETTQSSSSAHSTPQLSSSSQSVSLFSLATIPTLEEEIDAVMRSAANGQPVHIASIEVLHAIERARQLRGIQQTMSAMDTTELPEPLRACASFVEHLRSSGAPAACALLSLDQPSAFAQLLSPTALAECAALEKELWDSVREFERAVVNRARAEEIAWRSAAKVV